VGPPPCGALGDPGRPGNSPVATRPLLVGSLIAASRRRRISSRLRCLSSPDSSGLRGGERRSSLGISQSPFPGSGWVPGLNGAPAACWFSAVVREVVDNCSPIRAPPLRHRTALKDRTELLSETCRKISGAACLHASAPIDASRYRGREAVPDRGMTVMIRFGVRPKIALCAWVCCDPLSAAASAVPVEPGGQIATEQVR
jgi:hypothetical protein